jgi:hypothetical protein
MFWLPPLFTTVTFANPNTYWNPPLPTVVVVAVPPEPIDCTAFIVNSLVVKTMPLSVVDTALPPAEMIWLPPLMSVAPLVSPPELTT